MWQQPARGVGVDVDSEDDEVEVEVEELEDVVSAAEAVLTTVLTWVTVGVEEGCAVLTWVCVYMVGAAVDRVAPMPAATMGSRLLNETNAA